MLTLEGLLHSLTFPFLEITGLRDFTLPEPVDGGVSVGGVLDLEASTASTISHEPADSAPSAPPVSSADF